MVILENINIDKAILQNIDIDKISNRFKFGISNRASVIRICSLSFFKNCLESFLDCQNVFCTYFWHYIIVVEATMDMAEYATSWQSAVGPANFQPTIRGLKNDALKYLISTKSITSTS